MFSYLLKSQAQWRKSCCVECIASAPSLAAYAYGVYDYVAAVGGRLGTVSRETYAEFLMCDFPGVPHKTKF